jgi:predicted small lipoprotein YifL
MLREIIGAVRHAAIAPALAVGIGALGVAACGVKGPLKPPTPPVAAAPALPSEPPATLPASPPERTRP